MALLKELLNTHLAAGSSLRLQRPFCCDQIRAELNMMKQESRKRRDGRAQITELAEFEGKEEQD